MVSDDVYSGWEEIYRDNVERVYRIMFAKVGNRPDAEDLTAEVFMAALRPLRVSASVGEVRAYLVATAGTVLAAHWRRTLGIAVTTLDEATAQTMFTTTTTVAAPAGPTGMIAVSAGPAGTIAVSAGPVLDSPARAEAILAALPDRYARSCGCGSWRRAPCGRPPTSSGSWSGTRRFSSTARCGGRPGSAAR